MNIVKIAWRSIQHRGLGSALSVFSMSLGVMLLVSVLSVHSIVSKSFRSNSSFGYSVIVGAKGGNTQLVLNTVFYLSAPTGNIPYEYYLEFHDAEFREQDLRKSISSHHKNSVLESIDLCLEQSASFDTGLNRFGNMLRERAVHEQWRHRANLHRKTAMSRSTSMAIPMALGDYWSPAKQEEWNDDMEKYRVVGTTAEFFEKLVLSVERGEKFEFAEGRAFVNDDPNNRYFECVLGSRTADLARKYGIKLGDAIYPIHGDPATQGANIDDQGFKIVGMMKPTGTPHDRAVFINLEGFYLMEDHAKPIDDKNILGNESNEDDEHVDLSGDGDDDSEEFDDFVGESGSLRPAVLPTGIPGHQTRAGLTNVNSVEDGANEPDVGSKDRRVFKLKVDPIPLPVEQREVTAILVMHDESNDPYGMGSSRIENTVNSNNLEGTLGWSDYRPEKNQVNDAASAVSPVMEVFRLFEFFVNPIQKLLLGLTALICVVSGISILVGIYNSMSERRREIAVMRALGASRGKVMGIMLIETVMLATAGGALGWIAGHVLMWAFGGVIEGYTGIQIGLFALAPIEMVLFPVLLVLAMLVGIYPAITAYKTDVSKSLGA